MWHARACVTVVGGSVAVSHSCTALLAGMAPRLMPCTLRLPSVQLVNGQALYLPHEFPSTVMYGWAHHDQAGKKRRVQKSLNPLGWPYNEWRRVPPALESSFAEVALVLI